MRTLELIGVLMALIGFPGLALAHDSGTAKARFSVVSTEVVDVEISARIDSVRQLLGLSEGYTVPSDAALTDGAGLFFTVTSRGQVCKSGPLRAEPLGIHGMRLTTQLDCADTGQLFVTWVAAESPVIKLDCLATLVSVKGAERAGLLKQGATRLSSYGAEAGLFVPFAKHGAVHILVGWDHLAFLLVLLLGCGSWRRLATLVTGFTVAHSVTLALGATGIVQLSPRIVEPLIAASIAIGAIFALRQLRAERLELPGTAVVSSAVPALLLCVGFGLVHGLGFAGLLAEMLETTSARVVPLLAFNIGVELGQFAAVLVAFPLLAVMAKAEHARPAFAGLLLGLLGLGLTVAALRVVG